MLLARRVPHHADAWRIRNAEDFVMRSYKIDATSRPAERMPRAPGTRAAPRGTSVLIFALVCESRLNPSDSSNKRWHFEIAKKQRIAPILRRLRALCLSPTSRSNALSLRFSLAENALFARQDRETLFCYAQAGVSRYTQHFSSAGLDLTFHSPKNSVLLATGEKPERPWMGGTRISTWKSEIPLAVAGLRLRYLQVTNAKANDNAIDM